MDQSDYLTRTNELQKRLTGAMMRSLESVRWDRARLVVACAGQAGFLRIDYRDGQQGGSVQDTNGEAGMAVELRRVSWLPQSGTWFSIDMRIERSTGEVSTYLNWDEQFTEWITPPTDRDYIDDLLAFPRPWDRVPTWHPARKVATQQGWNEYLALRGLR